MKKNIQSQIKDQVINYLWNRINKLSNLIIKLEQENNILKYNLIESLKHVFLIKSQYNISSPLERILNNQNASQKNSHKRRKYVVFLLPSKLIDSQRIERKAGNAIKSDNVDIKRQQGLSCCRVDIQ